VLSWRMTLLALLGSMPPQQAAMAARYSALTGCSSACWPRLMGVQTGSPTKSRIACMHTAQL
jgi:hypothetical protein